MLAVFHDFRRLITAIQDLAAVLRGLLKVQVEYGPVADRLEALELSRHHFEAEIQGVLLKADGKLKAANNAEARERQLKRSYERDEIVGPLDADGAQGSEAETVLPNHAEAGEAERLHSLRLDVAPTGKALAVRAKFGM